MFSLSASAEPQVWNIGFFEGGSYPAHAELRKQIHEQLNPLLPENYRAEFVPRGFLSADWNRDTSRAMAKRLTADTTIDLIFAIGPWSVEDLLEAGFDRPIVAMFRWDPVAEGIADSTGRPVAENLTVRIRPGKIASDLSLLANLSNTRRLGVLYFPSNDESPVVIDEVKRVGARLGMEVVSGEGYDREGTFALFHAYDSIDGRIDALYLPPLWGVAPEAIRQFYTETLREGVPVISAEGRYQVERGAALAGSGESVRASARVHAWKAAQIIQGATPADLKTVIPEYPGVLINEFVARRLRLRFRDDMKLYAFVIEPPPPQDVELLRLQDAVERAQIQNPGFRAKYDALKAAAAAAGEAWSQYLPQLTAVFDLQHVDDNTVHNDDRFENDQIRAKLRLDQQLFSAPVIHEIKEAATKRDYTEIGLREASLDLEMAVSLAYLNYLEAQQVRLVHILYRNHVQEGLQVARMRWACGDGLAGDQERLEHEWLSASRALSTAESNLKIAAILFNNVIGRPGDYRFELSSEEFSAASMLTDQQRFALLADSGYQFSAMVDHFVQLSVKQNPEYWRSDLSVQLADRRLKRNSSSFLPTIGFHAELGYVSERASRADFEEENNVWSAGIRAELPLFLGGSRFKERNRLRSLKNEQEFLRDSTSLANANAIERHVRWMLDLAAVFPTVARSMELSSAYTEYASSQYNTKQRSMAELLDALRNERDASLEAINLQFTYFETAARLARATGVSPSKNGRSPHGEVFARLSTLIQTE